MSKTSFTSNEYQIEKAISFLVRNFNTSGHNPKPVIFHSIRVGTYLFNKGYADDVVVSGFLHDLIEDSDVTRQEVEDEFGTQVSEIVVSVTFDESIEGKLEKFREVTKRTVKQGRNAMIVRAADLIDNSHYYHLATSEEQYLLLLEKYDLFLGMTANYISQESIWVDLNETRQRLVVP